MARRSRSGLIERLLRFSVQHPWGVLVAVAVLTVAAVPWISGVRLRLDGRSLIPEDLPAQVASDRAAELFNLRDVVVVGVASPVGDIYSPWTLGLLSSLSGDLAGSREIVPGSVASLATVPRFFIQEDVLDPQPLLARGYPLGEELIARLRRETETLGLDDGVLVSRDGSMAGVYAEVHPEADRYRVLEQVRGLAARTGAPGSILLSGTALAQAVLGLAAAQDLIRLLPAVLLAIFLALTVLFRHPVPALVSLAEIGVSLVWTAGIMGARGESLFVTTLVLPVILLVIGVSDDVYALSRTFRRLAEAPGEPMDEAVVGSFAAVGHPILLTGATTVAGLLSLTATDLEPQRVFGFYGGLSILFSTLFTFTFVPALLSLLRPSVSLRKEANGRSGGRPPALIRGLRRIGPRRFLAMIVAVVVLASWASTRLRIEDDWVRNLPSSSDVASGTRELDRALAGTIRVEILVDSRRRDGFLDPAVFARLGGIEKAFAALPGVGAVHSIYGDVVRVQSALEGERYAAWRSALDGGRRALSRADLEQALLLLSSLRRSPLSEHIDADYRRARVTVFIRSANYSRISRIVQEASALSGGGLALTPFGDGWISYLAVRLLVLGQIQSVGFALVSNALLLLLLFRRLSDTMLALAPILVSVLLVFAALALAGIPLGIANSMFAAIALGIGVDYSIHLVAHYREQRGHGRPATEAIEAAVAVTGPAIFKSAAAIATGLSVLGFSEVLPNLQLGMLVTLSLTACAAMTLLLVPGIVLALAKES